MRPSAGWRPGSWWGPGCCASGTPTDVPAPLTGGMRVPRRACWRPAAGPLAGPPGDPGGRGDAVSCVSAPFSIRRPLGVLRAPGGSGAPREADAVPLACGQRSAPSDSSIPAIDRARPGAARHPPGHGPAAEVGGARPPRRPLPRQHCWHTSAAAAPRPTHVPPSSGACPPVSPLPAALVQASASQGPAARPPDRSGRCSCASLGG